MRILIFLVILTSSVFNHLSSQCLVDPPSLGELLLDENDHRAIFTCKVISDWKIDERFFKNEAKVLEVFRGEVPTNVNLTIYFQPNRDEKILYPGEEFLVISSKNDEGEWSVFKCDPYSESLNDSAYMKRGQDRLNIIGEFFKMKKEKLTKKFKFEEYSISNKQKVTVVEGEFLAGEPEGEWNFYEPKYPDRIVCSLNFSEGLLNGVSTEISSKFGKSNRNIHRAETLYKDGKKVKTDFFKLGTRDQEQFYSIKYFKDKKGRSRQIRTKFYPHLNRGKWYETECLAEVYGNNDRYPDIEYVMDGIQKEFYGDGELKVKGQYFRGAKVGKWITYNEDGSINEEEEFNNVKQKLSKKEFKIYFPDGKVMRSGKVKNNQATGVWLFKDIEGVDKYFYSEIPFKNGMIHGQMKRYRRKDDVLVNEWDYVDNQKHGFFNAYSDTGELVASEEMKNGKKLRTVKAPDKLPGQVFGLTKLTPDDNAKTVTNGEVNRPGMFGTKERFFLENGYRTGNYSIRSPKDELITEGNFKNGQKIGVWKAYGTDKKTNKTYVRKECFYGDYKQELPVDMKPEKCIKYDESGKVIGEDKKGFPY